MSATNGNAIKKAIQTKYSETARGLTQGCGCSGGCCGGRQEISAGDMARKAGYSTQEIRSAPAGANMGLGCGNPQALAALKLGEVVLDLGCGGGFDCFLAARQVGGTGRVIGVDMTPEMVEKARNNALGGAWNNVSFRLGEIEHLPVADGQVDVILSNCVVNLSPDKAQVFREAFRVLKPGGRLAISDTIAVAEMPEAVRRDVLLHAGCVAGALQAHVLEAMMRDAGFTRVSVRPNPESGKMLDEMFPGLGLGSIVVSAVIEAVKP